MPIAALIILRSLPMKVNRSKMLYVGMAMIMTAFIGFMLLGRQGRDYLIVDTLMLGACGIFDLFWWSILGEMLDFTKRPAAVFGIGLSANVLGVLCGDLLGMTITSINLPDAEVAVIALSVVCVTLVLLPPLNRQLVMLLKNHLPARLLGHTPGAKGENRSLPGTLIPSLPGRRGLAANPGRNPIGESLLGFS